MRSAVFALFLLAGSASVPAAEIPGRYVLEKTEDGFLRLDTETGAVALCAQQSGVWECTNVKDEGLALSEEIARLRTENDALRTRLAELEKNALWMKLPTDQDVDRMMDVFGRMVERFMGFAREMEGKTKEDAPI